MSNYLARELHLSRPGPYPYWALMLHAQDASYLQRGQADPEALLRIWSNNLSPFVSWGGARVQVQFSKIILYLMTEHLQLVAQKTPNM